MSGELYSDKDGNVFMLIDTKSDDLIQEMHQLELKEQESEGKEKHVPVIEHADKKIKVTVGQTPHPMEQKHYINLIELLKDGKVIYSRFLYPDDEPVGVFPIDDKQGISARSYCNIHGYWTQKV